MNRKAIYLIAISMLLAVAGQAAFAQGNGSVAGAVHGYVTDVSGKPVAAATVNLYGDNTLPTAPAMTSTTDASGFYAFNNLQAGNYSIEATQDYFAATRTTHVSGGNSSMNIMLPKR